ncbi:phosphopentomutase [Tannockella kyphosi]|uniref:phosphopentomutase n=1 Tax=Tannockella kyphosi TaxID=2899121 RepID=UPI0020136D64|nr:phosphopentomutase [Tannockella kyphosi]
MKYKRIFVIVLDSLGIGASKDAKDFGDEGANTLESIAKSCNGLNVPNLEGIGLGSLGHFSGIYRHNQQLGYTVRLEEISNGKDTMTGHYEMMGLKTEVPFVTFTETGFPQEFIDLFEQQTGRKTIGNIAASGTEILDKYGEHQIKTGDWIVYTSADSVFQIAANEEIISIEELYKACEIAREIAMDPRWKVGRVIARPYIGKHAGAFKRTPRRHDWALAPTSETVLDTLKDNNFDVIGVGKIPDIFCDHGITRKVPTISNHDGMEKTIEISKEDFEGLAFVNLVDFDAVYGHRRDPIGYGKAIVDFDAQLETLMAYLKDTDLLMLTADHGNDPTFKGTDHTREMVPLLMYSKSFIKPRHLQDITCFGVIGATIAENFGVKMPDIGESILELLK